MGKDLIKRCTLVLKYLTPDFDFIKQNYVNPVQLRFLLFQEIVTIIENWKLMKYQISKIHGIERFSKICYLRVPVLGIVLMFCFQMLPLLIS